MVLPTIRRLLSPLCSITVALNGPRGWAQPVPDHVALQESSLGPPDQDQCDPADAKCDAFEKSLGCSREILGKTWS